MQTHNDYDNDRGHYSKKGHENYRINLGKGNRGNSDRGRGYDRGRHNFNKVTASLEGKAETVPDAWDIAIDSIKCNPLTVRSTNMHAVNIEPYETVTINGIARNVDAGISEVVTENLENSKQVTICPRMVTVDHQGSYSKIQV
ncbi:hypothetical protein ACJMK2_007647 [Sinanodonta woodiana]|uniref:Uncharacterized protein n=1 Tax=Sinanodonta woodiana TaxID=1069815 RepID=A0ABD3VM54_SINWO